MTQQIAKLATLILALGSLAAASTIQYVGEPTGVNDGRYYVMPYQVTIEGASQIVTCIDFLDDVRHGDVWQADILNPGQAAASGFFGVSSSLEKYERAAWLSVQSYSNTDQQIGLQYAIWNIFSSVSSTPASLSYEAQVDAAASTGYANFDFNGFRFIQQAGAVSGTAGTQQAFVFQTTSSLSRTSSGSSASSATPEPGTLVLIGTGLVLIAFGRRKIKLLRPVPADRN